MEIDNIYNMDCVEGMRGMEDNSVDAIITSPPYNFCLRVRGEDYTKRSKNEEFGHTGQAFNKYTNGLTDDLDMEDYYEWVGGWAWVFWYLKIGLLTIGTIYVAYRFVSPLFDI